MSYTLDQCVEERKAASARGDTEAFTVWRAREDALREADFDPIKHPRGRGGMFRDVLGKLTALGDKQTLHVGGYRVHKAHSGHFQVNYPDGGYRTTSSARDAARHTVEKIDADEKERASLIDSLAQLTPDELDKNEKGWKAAPPSKSKLKVLKAIRNERERRRVLGHDKQSESKLEGPFTYPSGWKGRYDPKEGRYLGMDDVYMPRDFDPHSGHGAMTRGVESRTPPRKSEHVWSEKAVEDAKAKIKRHVMATFGGDLMGPALKSVEVSNADAVAYLNGTSIEELLKRARSR